MKLPFHSVVLYSPPAPGIVGRYPGIGDYIPGISGLVGVVARTHGLGFNRVREARVVLWLGLYKSPLVLALPCLSIATSRVCMRIAGVGGDGPGG